LSKNLPNEKIEDRWKVEKKIAPKKKLTSQRAKKVDCVEVG
jgi:hypothetical protein